MDTRRWQRVCRIVYFVGWVGLQFYCSLHLLGKWAHHVNGSGCTSPFCLLINYLPPPPPAPKKNHVVLYYKLMDMDATNRDNCQINKKTSKQSLKRTWPILSGLRLTLMLTALGRVFSSNTPLLPLSLSPITTASPTASLSSSSSIAWQLHLCFS